MTEFEAMRLAVKREFPTLAYFINWLQSAGMEAVFIRLLVEKKGYGDNAVPYLDDLLRTGIDESFPRNMPFSRLFNEDDIEAFAHLAMPIDALSRLASELPSDQFPREAIPSDACIKALYGLFNEYKARQTPPARLHPSPASIGPKPQTTWAKTG